MTCVSRGHGRGGSVHSRPSRHPIRDDGRWAVSVMRLVITKRRAMSHMREIAELRLGSVQSTSNVEYFNAKALIRLEVGAFTGLREADARHRCVTFAFAD